MKIRFKAFGIAREIIGQSEWEEELPSSVTLDDLRITLISRYPSLKTVVSFSLAVNQTYVSSNLALKDGDEVAIIPPVSGG